MAGHFGVLTMIDNWSRESVLLEVGFRLAGQSVVDALNRVGQIRKLLSTITADHGTEFTSLALDEWAHVNQVALSFTRPESLQTMGFANHLTAGYGMSV